MPRKKTKPDGSPKRKYTKNPLEVRKNEVWRKFSLYVRRRDCLLATGSPNHGRCCTCGKAYPITRLQAGHFVPGRHDAVLFDADGVHTQCYRCNMKLGGNWPRYYRYMQEHYPDLDLEAYIDKAFDAEPFITLEWLDEYEKNLDEALNEMGE